MIRALLVRLHRLSIVLGSPPLLPLTCLVGRYYLDFPQRPMPVLHGFLRSCSWCVSLLIFTPGLPRTTFLGLSPPPFTSHLCGIVLWFGFVFPSKGSVLFSLVSPMMSSPSLRPVCLLLVLPLPYHPHVIGRIISVLLLILPLRSFRSVIVARGRCRSPPTPLHRSGKVNRARGSP